MAKLIERFGITELASGFGVILSIAIGQGATKMPILLWLLGVPLSIVIVLALVGVV